MPKQPDEVPTMEAEIEAITPKKGKSEDSFGKPVQVRITKFGNMQVSTGEHIPEHGDRMALAGMILTVDQSVADQLEAKGFAEIQ